MKLLVRPTDLSQPRLAIDVQPSDTVASVKRLCAQEKRLAATAADTARYILIFQGKVLADDASLESLGLVDSSFLVLHVSKPPASLAAAATAAATAATPATPAQQAPPLFSADAFGSMLQQLMQQYDTAPAAAAPPNAATAVRPMEVVPPVVRTPAATPAVASTLPEPNPADVQMMIEMGFPEPRVRKALLLNGLSLEAAIEWLGTHAGDVNIDTPLTAAQRSALAQRYAAATATRGSPTPTPTTTAAAAAPPPPTATAPSAGGSALRAARVQEGEVDPVARSAIDRGVCTYAVTGERYTPQYFYQCFDCGVVAEEGVCESCRQTCHRGHHLSPARWSSRFFCDCGAGSVRGQPCKCLRK